MNARIVEKVQLAAKTCGLAAEASDLCLSSSRLGAAVCAKAPVEESRGECRREEESGGEMVWKQNSGSVAERVCMPSVSAGKTCPTSGRAVR